MIDINEFDAIRIGLASSKQIRDWSSGEVTKVVQRVPVRILIDRDERWPQLAAGLSVTVAIEHGPGDLEWAKQAADEMRALEATVKPPGE